MQLTPEQLGQVQSVTSNADECYPEGPPEWLILPNGIIRVSQIAAVTWVEDKLVDPKDIW